ncbi:DNA polymerase III subunit alpha [[Clostridium] sordellii]|uniref:PHP domain-containing protein n=1 Tax=Paraclostridium sordellii TaxID=1505 RepID=UPI0005E956A1|nr:PHP domain-containing protein [Paeniclostridium sordellii]CEQ01627.1 DNA polymerase III subunit alpha [[Clostridium] sordellii] [Paeniclostridium sordellii]
MEKNYTVLHLHSMLSNATTNIDSVTKYEEYIYKAKECGMKAIAFTEHGNIFNHIKKRNLCKKLGIKYIHGVECYITETLNEKIRDNYHCCLYAKNYDGYLELNSLLSDKNAYNRNSNNFHYAPRITFDDLLNTSNNIIITSACLGNIINRGSKELKEKFLLFMSENKDRCFLEIQHHNVIDQNLFNNELYELSKKYNIRLSAGTDTHALDEKHVKGRNILQQSKNIHFDNEDGWDLTFKTYNELVECYKSHNNGLPMDVVLEAIENTNVIANMVEEYEIDNSVKYPQLYDNPLEIFKQKIQEGVIRRGIYKYDNYETEYIPRIREELDTYIKTDSINYMLLQEKISSDAKDKGGVEFGYGRGSVNGSIIAYILGIVEVDAIVHGLNFYRFMNPDRVSMADIDGDHSDIDREWVRDYIYKMEGLYISDIITFNTIALKGSIRDVGRVFIKEYPDRYNSSVIDEIVKMTDENKEHIAREQHPELFEYVDIINGTVVSIGSHPAGVIVSPIPLENNIGTCMLKDNSRPVSVLDMKEVESLGFVKLDILGLDTISIINETCKLANIPRITPDTVDIFDDDVWDSIIEDTTSIFQFESDMAKSYLGDIMRPHIIEKIKKRYPNIRKFDLFMLINGAIRPVGEHIRNEVANGICGESGIKDLDDMLSDTLGYCLLQEQIMQFLVDFCGYSQARSDILRRAIGKKEGTEKYIEEIREGFLGYTPKKYNLNEDQAAHIIDDFIETVKSASNYGFSKNHNVPYAFTGYIAGYLRHYYKLEFATASLNVWTRKNKPDKIQNVEAYNSKIGIHIKDPKFRYSKAEYFMDKETNSIYKGIESIKFLNADVADYLYSLRENKYNSFSELLFDIKGHINSRQLDILIKIGFFEEFGKTSKLIKVVDAFNTITTKKTFKYDNEYIDYILPHAAKASEKQVKEVDYHKIMNDIEVSIKDEDIPIGERIQAHMEYMGNCTLKDDTVDMSICVVTNVDTKYSPKVTLYCIATGKTSTLKISKPIFRENKLELFDTVIIEKIVSKPKKKLIDGKWVKLSDCEFWLETYLKIN